MRRLGKRILSFCMAVWLFLTMTLDGQAKAAIAGDNGVFLIAGSAIAISGGDTSQDTATKQGLYEALDSLKAIESSEDEVVFYRNNGLDIVWDSATGVIDKSIQDSIGSACLSAGNKINQTGHTLIATSRELTQSATNIQSNIDGLRAKLGQPGSKGTGKRLEKELANQAQKQSDALTASTKGNIYKVGGKVLSAVSIGFDTYSIYKDCESLGDLKNEHASLRAVEGALYVTDIGFSVASISVAGIVLAGGTVALPVTAVIATGGLIVGIASSIVGSEGFANIMNNYDSELLTSFDNMVSSLFQNVKTAFGIGCYKPNIYIYGADGRLVRVIFEDPGLVVASDPYYDPTVGWSVTAESNGALWDERGEEHEFLFYESVTERNLFNTEEGFYISADKRSEDFRNILSQYGFNQAEVNDFVEFWDEKLEAGREYLMYPQYTDTVDKAMPVVLSPAPDNICRMWFVFEEYNSQDYIEADITPLTREGYYVVEWGGMIF